MSNTATITQRFFGRTQAELAALKAWACSVNLPLTERRLDTPMCHRGETFSCELAIGPIELVNTELIDSLDKAEGLLGYETANDGSFKVREDDRNAGGAERFAKAAA